jgi:CMP-N-acetylneuraminic acid synthetase
MICIIPARRNSKGLRNKNIKNLNGIPLIQHSINVAKKSKEITNIIISTDDSRIIKRFQNDKKIKIPFVRPKNLSHDNASSIDVYLHAIRFLEKKEKIESFCVLLPTCPIRNYKDIDKAISIFRKKKLGFLISVTKSKPLEFHFKINKNKFMQKLNEIKMSVKNRQKLPEVFTPNGSLYIFNVKKLKKEKSFMRSETYCYEMNRFYSQDIDDEIDFKIIKKLLKK